MFSCSDPATMDQLSVTCSRKSICAVKGSKVTLWCSYPSFKIKTVFWFSEKQSTNWRKNNEPEDLTLDSDYSGRVIHQISSSSSTLTIIDSGQFRFFPLSGFINFHTNSVLQVRMNSASTGPRDQRVILTCDLTSRP